MVSLSVLSVLALTLCPQLTSAKNLGYHSLQFDVFKGTSFEDARARRIVKRDNALVDPVFDLVKRADNTVEMILENQNTFYSVTLKIGSNRQEVIVLVDTGSSDLWVTSSTNPFCAGSSSSSSSTRAKFRKVDDSDFYSTLQSQISAIEASSADKTTEQSGGDLLATKSANNKAATTVKVSSSQATIDCSLYGTFDSSSSSSFRSNNTDFYILYGDTSFALGTWGVDNLEIGGLEVENLSFAVASQTNSTVGVLGIGLEGLETTNAGALAKSNPYTYSNLPVKLVEDGLIKRRVYSLYLNAASASSGIILFGGVDHAKYTGSLQTIPIINTLASFGYPQPIKLEVTLSGISYDGKSISTSQNAALLDSGTTLTYAPSSLISKIASAIGASFSSKTGYYMMSCPTSTSNVKNITFSFQGVEINAPLSNFILQATSTQCVLGMLDSGDDSLILGDSFLRSAYIVYDLDNLEVSLAQVNYTDETNIDAVTDSTIPSATRAASFSQTLGVTGGSSSTRGIGLVGTGIAGISTSGSGSAVTSAAGNTVQTISRSRTSVGSSATASSSSSNINKNEAGRLVPGLMVTSFLLSLLSLY